MTTGMAYIDNYSERPAQVTTFRYDPAGIRTTVINPDGSKLLQPFPHYEEERSASGTLLKRRTSYSLAGQLIALEQDGVIRYANTDNLGSPTILMTTSGGNITSSIARYKPYGGYLTAPTTTALDRGYTGHDRTAADDGLGLVYMNARYYDSSTGRFISPDTIVPDPDSPQAFNRYTYVGNSPLVGTDPDGHCWPVCTALIGGAVGGAIGGTLQAVQNVRNGQPLMADVGKAVAVGAVAGAVGATTFGAGVIVGGTIMGAVGITTASGAAATVGGFTTVALSSVAAGQSSRLTSNVLVGQEWHDGLGNPSEMAIDAVAGAVGFSLTGGNFSQLAPSNLTSRGMYARNSIAAKGPTASTEQREQIQALGGQAGCHHCGSRSPGGKGTWVADHIPPTSMANGSSQRLYPQCNQCRSSQASFTRWPNSPNVSSVTNPYRRFWSNPTAGIRLPYGVNGGGVGSVASSQLQQ